MLFFNKEKLVQARKTLVVAPLAFASLGAIDSLPLGVLFGIGSVISNNIVCFFGATCPKESEAVVMLGNVITTVLMGVIVGFMLGIGIGLLELVTCIEYKNNEPGPDIEAANLKLKMS